VLDRLAAGLPDDEATRFVENARADVPTTTERERRKERFGGLTDREREVVAWVARGLTNAEIARGLSVSSRTVEKHVEHAMAKLGVSSRVQLASWALRRDGAGDT
jgi:DNA-binding CsgD family transcriptional regulator